MAKKPTHDRNKNQSPVRATTWNAIMLKKTFRLGMEDAAAGRFDPDREEVRTSGISGEWAYERGFAFGRVSKLRRLDKINGQRIAHYHVKLFHDLSRRWPNGLQGEPTNNGGIL